MNVDSSHTEYTLSSLTSDTLYMVRMAAYTDEGGKDGPEFTFTTPKFGEEGTASPSATRLTGCLGWSLVESTSGIMGLKFRNDGVRAVICCSCFVKE